ncbi:leucine-rich repeat-containing protein 63 [Zootoca vivipara]|uniref:leucine-rich repeat-containing protein 63 n=1 Tax=Zootoca vivipara TaxID=8524 RepID=UPI00293C136F|nr:leucine-rich repeat-containing protein 63 [Zootoca vivipara]
MSGPKLLRRPLSPKGKTERTGPSRKGHKGNVAQWVIWDWSYFIIGACEEDTKFRGKHGTDYGQLHLPEKSQAISSSFPDFGSEIQVPANIERTFDIPSYPSGPPSFPLHKRRVPLRMQMPFLRDYRLLLQRDFVLKGPAIVATIQVKCLDIETTRPIISRLNYEVLTSELIARETRGPSEVHTILFSNEDLPLPEPPRKSERQMELGTAFFLFQLPDLSPLASFLLYLNLSFNYLYFFPTEVFYLKHLEVLKLRNNPIKFIPEDICRMKNLKLLVMSFNLLTTLPAGLFSLPNLQGLDVSYNELEFIPNEIGKLRNLTYLNVEGNLLYVLPCGLLKLKLSCLKVENNFLHAYFWDEICRLEPQRLTDMAAFCFAKHNLWKVYRKIPRDIHEILLNVKVCDCCTGPLYGKGLQFPRIFRNVYGLSLPYLFSACSPTCYSNYIAEAAEAAAAAETAEAAATATDAAATDAAVTT